MKVYLTALASLPFWGKVVAQDGTAFTNVEKWHDDDYTEPFMVDTTQILGETGTLFSQNPYDGTDSTVLVIQITPTIVADTNIRCELTCTDLTIAEVLINMKYGSPPNDIFKDGTEAISQRCPLSLSLNTFHDATLFVSVANAGGVLLDGVVTCTSLSGPSPPPTPSPTKPPTAPSPICFSEESTVQVQGKGVVEMKDLKVNDKVKVGNKGPTTKYEDVYAFGHYQQTAPTDYLKIHTKSSSLEISAAHLLYLAGKDEPVRADTVVTGDSLRQTTLDGETTMARVTKVESITRRGAYMPLTKSGNIVVNDYHASAYVSIFDEAPQIITTIQSFFSERTLLHWWLAPYRMVCLGISSRLCENDYNEEGIAYWLVLGREIARAGDGLWIGFQLVGLAVAILFMATCMALEAILGHFLLFCLSCAVLMLARKTRGGIVQKQLKLD